VNYPTKMNSLKMNRRVMMVDLNKNPHLSNLMLEEL